MLSPNDLFLTATLWLHTLAAAAWLGGGLFYLIVLIPALKRVPDVPRALAGALRVEFRTLVITSIIVLIATGGVLAFERLTEAGTPYAATLALKTVLSIWMFAMARDRRRSERLLATIRGSELPPRSKLGRVFDFLTGYRMFVALGLAIFLLSDVLATLYQNELRDG